MPATNDLYGCLEAAARRHSGAAAQLAAQICQIPAPTGAESERANFIVGLWEQRGHKASIDEVGNVCVQRGPDGGRALMLAAHLDTVFPASTSLTVERRGDRLQAPGIGDNSLGLAALLTLSDMLDELELDLASGVHLVADVGEEGLGNLTGIRAAVDRHCDDLGAVIAVEGHNLGRVTNAGVGSKRWNVTVRGPGGHSWGAYGQPSAIHLISSAISEIAAQDLPTSPPTSFNVGLIRGGTSVNTIAAEAVATIDIRSTVSDVLEELARDARRAFERLAGPDVQVEIDVLGERPVGAITKEHPLVDIAQEALVWAGVDPVLDASSTDANYPLSLGIPAICIGITRGGRGHTVDEYISVAPIATGLAQLGRLVVDVTSWLHEGS